MVSVYALKVTMVLTFIRYDIRASTHVFQKPEVSDSVREPIDAQIANSTVTTYLGLDKREGLVNIGRRLLEGTPIILSDRPLLINLR